MCVYLKEAICSPADTEPEVSVSKAKGNIHQGRGNQASCRWQHQMGVSCHGRSLHARMPGCTDPLFLAGTCVCHPEDGLVRHDDHHMMAVQIQLANTRGTSGLGYVVYTATKILALVSNHH